MWTVALASNILKDNICLNRKIYFIVYGMEDKNFVVVVLWAKHQSGLAA